MTDDLNPYQSPVADASAAIPDPLPLFVVGAVLGGISFIAAVTLIPAEESSRSVEGLLLANYLGFTFPLLLGGWTDGCDILTDWQREPWPSGARIGTCCYLLGGDRLLAVMVACPCLLGGVACVAFGSGERSWYDGILTRFGKGLLAGCVFGLVGMIMLNVLGISWFQVHSTAACQWTMWNDGPVGMGAASGLYLVLFVWAANLGVLPLKL